MTTTDDSSPSRADYDSPWKEVLEFYFEPFMLFFFPDAHSEIDWSREHTFLDKELQQVVRDSQTGRRLVDKLVRVYLKDGRERWILVHVEVQGSPETGFSRRMFVYHYRLDDHHDRKVASFAVLADDDPEFRPDRYEYNVLGCKVSLQFRTAKLLDYERRWDELQESHNVFAVVVMAYLKARTTRKDPQKRLAWKIELTKMLYDRAYSRKDILELFRFIDWVMALPKELERGFEDAIIEYEEGRQMQYVTSIERRATDRGVKKGTLKTTCENLVDVLEIRFESIPGFIMDGISKLDDLSTLKMLHKKAVPVGSMEEFEQVFIDATKAPG